EPDSDLALEILRATACCVELLAAMKGYQVAIGEATYPLKIHIGIGVGALHRVRIGEPTTEPLLVEPGGRRTLPRREFFIAGQAVANAGEMEGMASKGELAVSVGARFVLLDILGRDSNMLAPTTDGPVMISEQNDLGLILRSLQGAYDLQQSGGDKFSYAREGILTQRPKYMSPAFMSVLTYVDESLAFYLSNTSDAAQFASTAGFRNRQGSVDNEFVDVNEFVDTTIGVNQLRNVSIVFLKLTELSVEHLDESPTLHLTQRIFMMIVAVLRRFNGCLRQFACDDKAASALIVFGLSGFAHERGEEVAALRAAWEIRDQLLQLVGGKFGIGVTSGVF
ncbi:hypothetical protein HK101_011918, partial [Irineochytrium annulatum]